jgi:hemerythrin-like domain-containing protein
MKATKCLREEHQRILRVLERFDVVLIEARATMKVSAGTFRPFLEFFRDFADQYHHAKEEDCLFPCLERCASKDDLESMRILLEEHQIGRKRVRIMLDDLDDANGGDAFAVDRVLDQAQKFRDLLIGHIGREDHGLFRAADDVVSGDDLTELLGRYDEADAAGPEREAAVRALEAVDCGGLRSRGRLH